MGLREYLIDGMNYAKGFLDFTDSSADYLTGNSLKENTHEREPLKKKLETNCNITRSRFVILRSYYDNSRCAEDVLD